MFRDAIRKAIPSVQDAEAAFSSLTTDVLDKGSDEVADPEDLGVARYKQLVNYEELENAISLLRDARDTASEGYSLAFELALFKALVARLVFYEWANDIDECQKLAETLVSKDWAAMISEESEVFTTSANAIATFYRSIPESSVEKAVSHYQSLKSVTSLPSLANAHLVLHLKNGDDSNFCEAMSISQQLLKGPYQFSSLLLASEVAWCKFSRSHGARDLSEGLDYLSEARQIDQEAQAAYTAGNAAFLNPTPTAGIALTMLKESIAAYTRSTSLRPPPHPYRVYALFGLGAALYHRFQLRGDLADLAKALQAEEEALVLKPIPHPDRITSLQNLSTFLRANFDQNGKTDDLQRSIAYATQALDLTPVGNPMRIDTLIDLGCSLLTLFQDSSDLEALDKAIALLREARQIPESAEIDQLRALHNLSLALTLRSELNTDLGNLEEALVLQRGALALVPPPSIQWGLVANNLGSTLITLFERTGQLEYLTEATAMYQLSLDLRPAPHPERNSSLMNVANAHFQRFLLEKDIVDVEKAIALCEEAIEITPSRHYLSPGLLRNLGRAYEARFEAKGDPNDMTKAIDLQKGGLKLRSNNDPVRSETLHDLGVSFWRRYQHTNSTSDLKAATAYLRQSLELRPVSHPQRPVTLIALGFALRSSHVQDSSLLKNLHEAVSFHREAVKLCSPAHRELLDAMLQLGTSLQQLAGHTGAIEHLDEAITLLRSALTKSSQSEHPLLRDHNGTAQARLAVALQLRYAGLKEPSDLEEAFSMYQKSSNNPSLTLAARLTNAKNWITAGRALNHLSLLDAYRCANDLFPQLASLDMTGQQRHAVLGHAKDIACDAAQYAIEKGELEEAVVFVSTGRAVFWSQALKLRPPLHSLRAQHPALTELLEKTASKLEKALHAGGQSGVDFMPSGSEAPKVSGTALEYHALEKEWQGILDEVRKRPGFEDFLLPKTFASLQRSAKYGYVVILNGSGYGFDALIVTSEGVSHLPLPHMTPGRIHSLQTQFRQLIGSDGAWHLGLSSYLSSATEKFKSKAEENDTTIFQKAFAGISQTSNFLEDVWGNVVRPAMSERLHRHTRQRQNRLKANRVSQTKDKRTADDKFNDLLETLWVWTVEPVIAHLQLKKQDVDSLPRIWWCLTGSFVFLPIHAAGARDSHVYDYAVSSYCTTPQDLLEDPPQSDPNFKMLAVVQPEVPGASFLPCAMDELNKIEESLSDFRSRLIKRIGPGYHSIYNETTNPCDVLVDLQHTSFAHFACHGVHSPSDPLSSYLLLSGGELSVSSIIQCRSEGGKAAFAYLSACETAEVDQEQPDESMNLAATMTFAGFRSVVGTMASIFDEDAPRMAEIFYGHLFRRGGDTPPDPTETACALHLAIQTLRKDGKSIRSWIPFVHFGM